MVARILFTSEIYIKGDSIEDIKKTFSQLDLFPMIRTDEVVEGVDFYDILCVEDADTHKRIPSHLLI